MATKPSLALIPSGVKASKVYSVLPSDGTGDFDFSRSGSATRVNKDGLIETVESNVPRLNYPLIDGVVSGCPSLLLEPQSTNLIPYSEIFEGHSSGYWQTFNNGTIETNYGISPQGIQNSTKIGTSGGSNDFVYNSITVSIGTVYTTSCYVKNIDATKSLIYGVNSFSNNLNWNGSQLVSIDNAEFEEVGNGWYRIWITSTAILSSNVFRIYSDRDVSAGSIEVYGFQVEQGSYPTSYIPTNGSAVTRVADAVTGNSSLGQVINSSEGVLYFEGSSDSAALAVFWGLNDGSTSNRVFIGYSGSVLFGRTVNPSDDEYVLGAITATNNNKCAIRWTSSELSLWANGVELGSSILTDTPNNLDTLEADSGAGSNPFYGRVRELKVYDTALTDAELAELTKI